MRTDKVARLQSSLEEEALLFTLPHNLHYLTGRENLEGTLLIARDKVHFFTDFRYLEEASRELEADVTDHKGSLLERILETSRNLGLKGLVFEKGIPYERYEQNHGFFRANGLDFRPGGSEVEELRMVKSSAEQAMLRRSAEINNLIYHRILEDIRPGVTERELKLRLECYLREYGGRGSSFDLMVLFGAHTSMPHGTAGDTRLEAGMPILFDIGVDYRGYASDMTRMAVLGEPDREFREAYDFVREVQASALELVRPGVEARSVDERVKEMLGSGGYTLEHGTGHGVGLEVHERPALNGRSRDILEAGMAVTIEPGIYLEGRFGVRIEDLLIVGRDGNEILSTVGKELSIL